MLRRLVVHVTAWTVLIAGPALVGPAVGVALAHAQLVTSSPGSGEVVETLPDELRLVFSEPLDEHYSKLDLRGPTGETVAAGIGSVDPNDRYALVAPLPDGLGTGVYTVEWRTLSTADGHTASGFFTFGVGDVGSLGGGSPAGGAPVVSGGVDHGGHDEGRALLERESRIVADLGILLAGGLPVIAWLVLHERRPIGIARVTGAALLVAAIGALGQLVLAGTSPGLDLVGYATASRTGLLLLSRVVVGAVAGAAVLALAPGRPRLALGLAGGAALVGIGLLSIGGHAAAYASPGPALAVLVHVGAAAVWLSGVVALAWCAIVDRRADRPLGELVPRFSALALVAVGLVGLSGLYSDWVQTHGVVSFDTPYTTALTVKIALGVGAFALGAANYVGRLRGAGPRGSAVPRTIGSEAVLAVLVVVATGVLASESPPAQERPVAIEQAISSAGAVERPPTFELAPGRPGPTRFIVTSDAVPAGGGVELVVQRLDTGAETRIALRAVGSATGTPGHGGGTGSEHGGAGTEHGSAAGTDHGGAAAEHGGEPPVSHPVGEPVQYVADGALLAADSRWDVSVVIRDAAGVELSRSRFAFALDEAGITEGRAVPAVDPALVIALALLAAAVLGLTFAAAGGSLPRTEPSTSRIAMLTGGVVGGALGLAILLGGLNL